MPRKTEKPTNLYQQKAISFDQKGKIISRNHNNQTNTKTMAKSVLTNHKEFFLQHLSAEDRLQLITNGFRVLHGVKLNRLTLSQQELHNRNDLSIKLNNSANEDDSTYIEYYEQVKSNMIEDSEVIIPEIKMVELSSDSLDDNSTVTNEPIHNEYNVDMYFEDILDGQLDETITVEYEQMGEDNAEQNIVCENQDNAINDEIKLEESIIILDHENNEPTTENNVPCKNVEPTPWFVKKTFPNFKEANTYLNGVNWSRVDHTNTWGGHSRIYYRCNKVDKLGPQCEARAYLLYVSEKKITQLYRNRAAHTHDEILSKNPKLPKTINQISSTDSFTDNSIVPFTDIHGFEWVLEDRIDSVLMIPSYTHKLAMWTCTSREPHKDYTLLYYHCHRVDQNGSHCAAQMCLVLRGANDEVLVYRTGKHLQHRPIGIMDNPNSIKTVVVQKRDAINKIEDTEKLESMISKQTWIFRKLFINLHAVNNFFFKFNDMWTLIYTKKQKQGNCKYYQCTFSNVPKCSAKIQLVIQDSGKIVFLEGGSHNHPVNTVEEQQSTPNTLTLPVKIIEIRKTRSDNVEAVLQTVDDEFTYIKKFVNRNAALKYMNESILWDFERKQEFNNEIRHYYKCKYHEKDENCLARVYLNFPKDCVDVFYFSCGEHHHKIQNTTFSPHQEHINDNDAKYADLKNKWSLERGFSDYRTAIRTMKELNYWTKNSKFSKEVGLQEFYHCKNSKGENLDCPAEKFLLYKFSRGDVFLYTRNVNHVQQCGKFKDDIDSKCSAKNQFDNSGQHASVADNETEIPSHFLENSIFERQFATSHLACSFMQKDWTRTSVRKEKSGGFKLSYRCTIPNSRELCPAKRYLFIDNQKQMYLLFKSKVPHTHRKIKDKITAKPPISNRKTSPKEFITEITESSLQNRHTKQLLLDDVKIWLEKESAIPQTPDEPFCVNYHINNRNLEFQCFFSTRRLLQNTLSAHVVHLDVSPTISCLETQAIVVGTSDINQMFHIFGLGLCSGTAEIDFKFIFKSIKKGAHDIHQHNFKPEVLITSGPKITEAFIATYPSWQHIRICSDIAMAAIRKKLDECEESMAVKQLVVDDLLNIQTQPSADLFRAAAKLFISKWESAASLSEFLTYFLNSWVNIDSSWCKGYPECTPSTNQAIRAVYDKLNQTKMFTEYDIESLKKDVKAAVHGFSDEYLQKEKPEFATKLKIPYDSYEIALQWNRLEKQVVINQHGEDVLYYVPSGPSKQFDCYEILRKYRTNTYETLDELLKIKSSIWCIKKTTRLLTCTCPYFLDHFVCKHSLGMASILQLIEFPQTALIMNMKEK